MDAKKLLNRLLKNDHTLTELILVPLNETLYFPYSMYEWKRLGILLGDNNSVVKLSISFPWDRFDPPRTLFKALYSLAYGLNRNRSIKHISFRDVDFREYDNNSFFLSMGSFFRNNMHLRVLEMRDCTFDEDCWRQLGRCIKQSNIKKIFINGTMISPKGGDEYRPLTVIPSAFRGTLDALSLVRCDMSDDHIDTITKRWKIDNLAPTTINLSNNVYMSDRSCDYLSRIMVDVRKLSLANIPIGNHGVYSLLHNNIYNENSLRVLNLDGTGINDVACEILQMLLQHESCLIKKLSLDRNKITSKGLDIILDSLKNNKQLQELSLFKNNINEHEWSTILPLICDESNINSTYSSNHTLKMIGGPSKQFYTSFVGKRIKQMLLINSNANARWKMTPLAAKNAGATKVVLSHLTNLSKSKSTFLDGTDDSMFPYTLGWLGEMNAYGGRVITLNAFYHLCQHNCNLFKLATRCINTPIKKRKICKISSEVSNII